MVFYPKNNYQKIFLTLFLFINTISLSDKQLHLQLMSKKIFTLFVSILFSCGIINAQNWTKEDSTWLINVMEGNFDLKINEDTKKAIEDGRLNVPSWMKSDDGRIKNIEISNDFNAGAYDSARIHSIDPYSMPPAVYSMYVLYADKIDSILHATSLIITNEEKEMLTALLPTGTIQAFSITYYNNYRKNPNVVTFANRGMDEMFFQSAVGSSVGYTTDFNHIFSMVFSPLYRRKAQNSKNAIAYKAYYDEGAIRAVNIPERERRQMRQQVIKIRPVNIKTSEFRQNGIDD